MIVKAIVIFLKKGILGICVKVSIRRAWFTFMPEVLRLDGTEGGIHRRTALWANKRMFVSKVLSVPDTDPLSRVSK